MVVLAAAATWLGLARKENLERMRSRADLGLIADAIAKVVPAAGHRRPYAPRNAQDTEVISLILPSGLAHLIETYANAWGFSKNDLCGNLLMKGLIIYMTGEKNLLEAIAPAHT